METNQPPQSPSEEAGSTSFILQRRYRDGGYMNTGCEEQNSKLITSVIYQLSSRADAYTYLGVRYTESTGVQGGHKAIGQVEKRSSASAI